MRGVAIGEVEVGIDVGLRHSDKGMAVDKWDCDMGDGGGVDNVTDIKGWRWIM